MPQRVAETRKQELLSGSSVDLKLALASGFALKKQATTSGMKEQATASGIALKEPSTASGIHLKEPVFVHGIGLKEPSTASGNDLKEPPTASGGGLKETYSISGFKDDFDFSIISTTLLKSLERPSLDKKATNDKNISRDTPSSDLFHQYCDLDSSLEFSEQSSSSELVYYSDYEDELAPEERNIYHNSEKQPSGGGLKEKPIASSGGLKEKPTASSGGLKEPPIASSGGLKEKPIASRGDLKEKPIASSGGLKEKPIASSGDLKEPPTASGGRQKESFSESDDESEPYYSYLSTMMKSVGSFQTLETLEATGFLMKGTKEHKNIPKDTSSAGLLHQPPPYCIVSDSSFECEVEVDPEDGKEINEIKKRISRTKRLFRKAEDAKAILIAMKSEPLGKVVVRDDFVFTCKTLIFTIETHIKEVNAIAKKMNITPVEVDPGTLNPTPL